MSASIIVGTDLFFLAIQTPADLVTASVIPDLLEALTCLYIGKLLATLILAKVHDEAGDILSTLHLLCDLFLHVFIDVALNTLLFLLHFSMINN